MSHFKYALIVVFLSIAVSLLAFITSDNNITGFVVSNPQDLREYENIDSLQSLGSGTYYIDGFGTVYWIDDKSMPAVAKVKFIDETQKNRKIYIDNDGDIGYLLE